MFLPFNMTSPGWDDLVLRGFGILAIGLLLSVVEMLVGCKNDRPLILESPLATAPTYILDESFRHASPVKFDAVSWVEIEPRSRLVYVLQRSNPPVSSWRTDGSFVASWNTDVLGEPHSLSFCFDSVGNESVWITDMAPPCVAGSGFGHCIKQFTMNGKQLATIGICGENTQGTDLDPIQFDKVTDVASDAEGNLLVSDGDLDGLNNRVLRLTSDGGVLRCWSAPHDQPGSGPLEFNLPHAVQVDSCGRIWITDALNHRVQIIGSDGSYIGQISQFGELGVYALAFGPVFENPSRQVLFVGTSPTTFGGTGTVFLFEIPMEKSHERDIGTESAFGSFDVALPTSSSPTLLHSIAVDPITWDVYIATLGGNLPPQKWTATWPERKDRLPP